MSTERNEVLAHQGDKASPQEKQAFLYERLIPILFVDDLLAERDFYVSLGFIVTYQGAEFPDFIALSYGSIEFGISRRERFTSDLPDRVLTCPRDAQRVCSQKSNWRESVLHGSYVCHRQNHGL